MTQIVSRDNPRADASDGRDPDPPLTHAPLHHRQFVVGPEAVRPDAGWRVEPLFGSLLLSHSPGLRVETVQDANGVSWWLLGRAVAAAPGDDDPVSQLARRSGEPVERLYRRWAGRWLLIGDGAVHPDAGATLGCLYRDAPDGTTWLSSSPALLNDLPGREPAPTVGPRLLAVSRGMDWYPPPASRFAGISRLLPSQVLAVDERRVAPQPRRLLDDTFAGLGQVALMDGIEGVLRTTLAGYAAAGGELWVPLTGGFDSRLVLAAAVTTGAPFTTYTFERPGVAEADLRLPPQLAELVEREHVRIRPGRPRANRRALFDLHTAEHSIEVDRELFARGSWDGIPRSALSLRGGIFEVARAFYDHRLPDRLPDDTEAAQALISTMFQFDRFHRGSAAHRDGIRRWVEWVARTPEPGLDWRDRLYLEQTVGGWLASTAQGLDLFACELAYPANSHILLSGLLQIDRRRRRRGDHHRDLIARMAPVLLSEPFNPAPRLPAQARGLVGREWHDFWTYPGRVEHVRHRVAWLRRQVRRRGAR